MSARIPPTPRSNLPNEQQKNTHDELYSLAENAFGDIFKWRREDGAMIGPMPFMLVAPKQGEQFLRLALSLGQIPGLPVEAKETAILATGAHFQAAYELYAHGKVARSKTGLTAQQVDDISSGKKPEGLSEQADVAYDVATYLCATPGPLKKNLWNRSMECLGKEGTAALVHYIGAYAYTCMILNAIDAPNPEGSE